MAEPRFIKDKNSILNHLKIYMSTLKDLLAQHEALTKQIKEVSQSERRDAISKVLALISEHKLTEQDLFGGKRGIQKVKAASKVAAKYRDPETGKEWSGRGIAPKWLNGKEKSQFLIVK